MWVGMDGGVTVYRHLGNLAPHLQLVSGVRATGWGWVLNYGVCVCSRKLLSELNC
jgi:hypothetical protein